LKPEDESSSLDPTSTPTTEPTGYPTGIVTIEPSLEPSLAPSLEPPTVVSESMQPTILVSNLQPFSPPPTNNMSIIEQTKGRNISVMIFAQQVVWASYSNYMLNFHENNLIFGRSVDTVCNLSINSSMVTQISSQNNPLPVFSTDCILIQYNISIANLRLTEFKTSASAFTSIFTLIVESLQSGLFAATLQTLGSASSVFGIQGNESVPIVTEDGFAATYVVGPIKADSSGTNPGYDPSSSSTSSAKANDNDVWDSAGAAAGVVLGGLITLLCLFVLMRYCLSKYRDGLNERLQERMRSSGRYDGLNDHENLIYST
jgi:hypothetical protein